MLIFSFDNIKYNQSNETNIEPHNSDHGIKMYTLLKCK